MDVARRTRTAGWPAVLRGLTALSGARLVAAIGDAPNRAAIIRLVGGVLVEPTDDWLEGRRYIGREISGAARMAVITTEGTDTEPRRRQSDSPPKQLN
ncbi:hypothetical protein [Dactylosporangium darangshiense]|uniref:Transposase n=1 Tax=Dactylosporangium darangshiense TaxID=579108 RepID=A0ABP8DVV6_9ACTN